MGGKPVVLETVRRHKDGRLIPVGISGAPIFDADGRVIGVAAVHRDMTENREYKEHLGFTLRELSHRTKNMLAVVQGLARMIARRSDDIDEFEVRFRGCIQALAYARSAGAARLAGRDAGGIAAGPARAVRRASTASKYPSRGPEVYLTPAGDAVARADHARARHQRDQARRAVDAGGLGRDRLDARAGDTA